jgi:hypothetical protein
MNVFLLDDDFFVASKLHTDKHVVKMALESAQMLSSAAWMVRNELGLRLATDGSVFGLYKPTHMYHPWVKWLVDAIKTRDACKFTTFGLHAWELALEYERRFDKKHGSQGVIQVALDAIDDACREDIFISYAVRGWKSLDTPLCMPQRYIDAANGMSNVDAYRLYYMAEKIEGAKWTRRKPDGLVP